MSGLSVTNISKNYGDVRALTNVNIEFEHNKIYALLGRNGAGKTTLLNIITGRIFADQGEVLFDGEPVIENDGMLQKLFMMGEKNFYPEGMRVSAAFQWTKAFYPGFDEKRAMDLAKQFGLNTGKKIKSLSTGYSSIFKLIVALCVNTPFVFLDEPVLGLDANHRDLFYKVLIEIYSESPSTFVLSTHLIEEVSGVIEEVIIIREGEIIQKKSREELLSKYYSVTGSIAAVDRFISGKKSLGADVLGGLKTAYVEGTLDRKTVPDDVEIGKMDLQKLFIQLTNAGGGKE